MHQAKAFEDNEGAAGDDESSVAERVPHLGTVPELFVSGAPPGDGVIAFALVAGVLPIHVAQPGLPNAGGLNDGDRLSGRVNHELPRADPRQRLIAKRILGHQRRRRGLAAIENGGHQLIPQRSGEGEFGVGETNMNIHASIVPGPWSGMPFLHRSTSTFECPSLPFSQSPGRREFRGHRLALRPRVLSKSKCLGFSMGQARKSGLRKKGDS